VDPAQLAEQLACASPDVLREMIATMANALMSAQADQLCGAEYGERSSERMNRRNGYRAREWDTRAGTVELAVPKLRQGSYFPDWLLTHGRRAEQALVTVVATAYLLGVSTRRVERLAEQLGIKSLSRSQVSEMATHLDAQVSAFRERALDAGPYTFVWVDALTVKVREDGRVVNVHALIATGVNADGTGRSSVWTSPPARTGRAGWRSCAVWSPAACPGSSWSSPTPIRDWSPRSARRCLGRPGGGVAPTASVKNQCGRVAVSVAAGMESRRSAALANRVAAGVGVKPSWVRIGPTSRTTSPMVRRLT
jgi:Transposase, Mutator family